MKWAEVQEVIRLQMLEQPRGYQAQIAAKLGKTPGFINQITTGRRPIPLDSLETILDSLNLTYDVVLLRKQGHERAEQDPKL